MTQSSESASLSRARLSRVASLSTTIAPLNCPIRWPVLVALVAFWACPHIVAFAQSPSPSSSASSRAESITEGQYLFQKRWTFEPAPQDAPAGGFVRGDGLGPMHNAQSCEACHVGGGASGVNHNVTLLTIDPRSPVITKAVEARRLDPTHLQELKEIFPGLVSANNSISIDIVVHSRSTRPFYDLVRKELKRKIAGDVPDEWLEESTRTSSAIAAKPVLSGRTENVDFYLSQRNSPPLYGLGAINRIEMRQLNKIALSQVRTSGGEVSGRLGVGRFGWRAQTGTLQQFVRGACAGELGLQLRSTPQTPDIADETYRSEGVDLNETQVVELTKFVVSIPAPKRQRVAVPKNVSDGERLFAKIGCAVCHVENIRPAYGIYSDLLLHDMGDLLSAPSPAPIPTSVGVARMRVPGLSDSSGSPILEYYGGRSLPMPYPYPRPEFPQFPYGQSVDASAPTPDVTRMGWDDFAREWRTPPLWGLADTGPYLHDGRAETIDAAIRWHGGEASSAATAYRKLTWGDQESVIAFLSSLKAPLPAQSALAMGDEEFLNEVGWSASEISDSKVSVSEVNHQDTSDSDFSRQALAIMQMD
ncbi:di-heme oxidoredictase family protein [Stieleria varia]|uniref:Cytochrome c domain-containing protein n=1 Tax=Stieleria varia TaxID=2528005 RepID=A0A5C6A5Z9_9BACT|nr:di-heme oxidoredictase family protein [Stieleria varia]TWT93763.1 hypothetical protein Pla52n_55910 [Stieleria varia]